MHPWLVSALKFFPDDGDYVYSASVDGAVCRVNVESHAVTTVCNLNAGLVYQENEENPGWRSIYSMDVDASRRALLVGDDAGRAHVVDARAPARLGGLQVAKKGTKVVALGVNAAYPSVFVTAGNDHAARIWDIRRASLSADGAGAEAAGPAGNKALALALATLPHPRVVNAAAFSPHTGRKLLTTCQDNRLRLWDTATARCASAPERELVHSHDFNRYLTAFRAVWDPKDASEAAVVIGRYISEDYGGVALHPIDVLSADSGRMLVALADPNVTTICPVALPHPRRDVVAAGSSRNIFVWEPAGGEDEAEAARASGDAAARARGAIPRMLDLDDGEKKKKKKGRGDDDDDDGPGFGGGKKKGRAA